MLVQKVKQRFRDVWIHRVQSFDELADDDLIETFERCTQTVRRSMLVLITLALFCTLTVLSAPDVALIRPEISVRVPFASVEISFLGFLVVAPFLLLSNAAYLHVFEGLRLDLVKAIAQRGRKVKGSPALFNIDRLLPKLLTGLIFYWLVPVAFALLTYKSLVRLEYGLSTWCVTIVVSVVFFLLCVRRNQGKASTPFQEIGFGTAIAFALIFFVWPAGYMMFSDRGVTALIRPAKLFRADLKGAVLEDLDLRNAYLAEANLENAAISDVNLKGAYLANSNLSSAKLFGVELNGAVLQGANLSKTRLNAANFQDAIMTGANFAEANLSGQNFSGADLEFADFFKTNLVNTNLTKAKLKFAKFKDVLMMDANLKGADLTFAEIYKSSLQGADLSFTDLSYTKFLDTNLEDANIDGANLSEAHFCHTVMPDRGDRNEDCNWLLERLKWEKERKKQ